jgi:hypothetical protein
MNIGSVSSRRFTPGNPVIRRQETTAQNQERALIRDIDSAKLTNTVTLGRQTYRKSDIQSKVRARPKASPAGAKRPATLTEKKSDFLQKLGEKLTPEEVRNLMGKASASLQALQSGNGNPEPVAVLAAHTYNFSKRQLQDTLPEGVSLQQARSQAKTSSATADKLALMDASAAYMRGLKAEQSRPAEPKPHAVSQEALAQIQADRVRTLLEVDKGWQDVWSEIQKGAAQRHQMAAETSQSISDIYQQLYLSQMKSNSKHAKQYVYLLTEVWPEA